MPILDCARESVAAPGRARNRRYAPSPGVHALPIDGPERALPRSTGPDSPDKAAPPGSGRRGAPARRARARRRDDARRQGRADGREGRRARRPTPADAAHRAARDRHAAAAAAGRDPRRPRHRARSPRCRASSRSTSADERYGLNTIELDVKDEGGEIALQPPSGVPLARTIGAVAHVLRARAGGRGSRTATGVYLIGRVVVFQDPYLARGRPDLAIQRPDGGVWTTSAGLALGEPVRPAGLGLRGLGRRRPRRAAGFDEIMLDYVRFPSDGDVANAVYPGQDERADAAALIADFVAYAKQRLQPLGVRVSTALFGLSATRDLGIGQVPRWISEHVDNVHADGLSGPLRRRRARHREPELASRARPSSGRSSDFRRRCKGSERAARPVDPGLELRARSRYSPQIARRPAPGRQGVPALERVGQLHEGRARARETIASRACDPATAPSRIRAPADRPLALVARPGRGGGSARPCQSSTAAGTRR